MVTDAPGYAALLLESLASPPRDCGWDPESVPTRPASTASMLAEAFFGGSARIGVHRANVPLWRYVVVSGFSPSSQYERLIGLARDRAPLPDGLACVARTGDGFRGFRGRSWIASPGNVHLTVHLAPERPIERFETVFMALAAVSVVEAVDSVVGMTGRAGIKWVNDVLVEGRKVAGVLAYSQTKGDQVTCVVLGIGLNVERVPIVPPTPFVPGVAALRSFATDPKRVRAGDVLAELLRAIERNYRVLLREGYEPIIDRYRARSIILGRNVHISRDDPDEVPRIFASGRVQSITDGLELQLSGIERPVNHGRLILPLEGAETISQPLTPTRFGVAL